MAKTGLAARVSVNLGCSELPCWNDVAAPVPDPSPLALPEFAALVERHQAGGDVAHVVEDWLRDRRLDAVADGWRALAAEGKGDRLRDYVAGILTRTTPEGRA